MKFIPVAVAALLAASSPAWATPAHKAAAPGHVALPAHVRPERYQINIIPNAQDLTFEGHEAITVTVKRTTSKIVLNAADMDAASQFYCDFLEFDIINRIKVMCFLQCNEDHHSLAFATGDASTLNHVAVLSMPVSICPDRISARPRAMAP